MHLQVANKRNGIDVDKFDYLERDAMMCGVGVPLDAKRLMLFSRVSPDRQQVRWLSCLESCPGRCWHACSLSSATWVVCVHPAEDGQLWVLFWHLDVAKPGRMRASLLDWSSRNHSS